MHPENTGCKLHPHSPKPLVKFYILVHWSRLFQRGWEVWSPTSAWVKFTSESSASAASMEGVFLLLPDNVSSRGHELPTSTVIGAWALLLPPEVQHGLPGGPGGWPVVQTGLQHACPAATCRLPQESAEPTDRVGFLLLDSHKKSKYNRLLN